MLHLATLVAAGAVSACGGSSGDGNGVTPPPTPTTLSLAPGDRTPAANGQSVLLDGGSGGSEYLLVVTDTTPGAAGTSSFQITAAGLAAAGTVSPPSSTRIASDQEVGSGLAPGLPALDIGYGARLNERARHRLTPMMSAARREVMASDGRGLTPSGRQSSVAPGAVPQVGDLVTYNVGMAACDSVTNHATRVVAVGTSAIIAVDTLDPPSGFTSADYQRFAANFDTLVYPLDVTNFGAPTDIDSNGHIVLLFTRAVNELTPARSGSYVGGFFFSRDLFPHAATQSLVACAGSNVAEMFYLLAPDPAGTINGNVRTAGLVDSMTTSLVGHEFQHLINASRRIFINNANDLEVVWLNEGLSHIAEELLFYRQSGLGPRQNITIGSLRTSSRTVVAFNTDQGANAARYKAYLVAPSTSSPIRNDDSLSTRGATWNYLRYAADRKLSAGGQDADVWQALVNSKTVGVANLRAVFGADLGGSLRDWSISHYTDDTTPNIGQELMQPSWNWHNLYPAFGSGGGTYPLQVTSLSTTGAAGSVIPGGSTFYRFAIPAKGTGSITVSGGTSASGQPIGTIVRLR